MHQFGWQRAWTGPLPLVEWRRAGLKGTAQKAGIAGEIETFPFETAARSAIGRHDVMSGRTATLSADEKPAVQAPRMSYSMGWWKKRPQYAHNRFVIAIC
jgi:hypothetical protein